MVSALIGMLIGAAIAGLIGGALTMLAGKVLFKQAPGFGEAFKANFFASLAMGVIRFFVGLVTPPDIEGWIGLGLLPVGFLVLMLMLQKQVGYTMGQSAAVAGVVYAIYLVVLLVLMFVVAGLIVASGAAAGG